MACAFIAALSLSLASAQPADVPQRERRRAAFLTEANEHAAPARQRGEQAGWVQNTYITPDTEAIATRQAGLHDRGDRLRKEAAAQMTSTSRRPSVVS